MDSIKLDGPTLGIVTKTVHKTFAIDVTEYFDPPENPGPGPNFTEKVGLPHTKDTFFLLKY